MSSQRYSPEFKDEAVRQVVERGYSVKEVSERLDVVEDISSRLISGPIFSAFNSLTL